MTHKPVMCVETGKTYKYFKDAAADTVYADALKEHSLTTMGDIIFS